MNDAIHDVRDDLDRLQSKVEDAKAYLGGPFANLKTKLRAAIKDCEAEAGKAQDQREILRNVIDSAWNEVRRAKPPHDIYEKRLEKAESTLVTLMRDLNRRSKEDLVEAQTARNDADDLADILGWLLQQDSFWNAIKSGSKKKFFRKHRQ